LDTVLGLFLLAVYIIAIVGLAALVTFVAIRIFPTKDRPEKKPDPPSADADTPAGRLFRRAKRAT
jgi:hypothetical protein